MTSSTATLAAPAVAALCVIIAMISALATSFAVRIVYIRRIDELYSDLSRLTCTVSRNAARLRAAQSNLALQRSAAAQAMEQQQAQHDQQIAQLREGAVQLSPNERELIRALAGKLDLASAALHAKQQFKDSREAQHLAMRGFRLAKRLEEQPHLNTTQLSTCEEPDPITDAEDATRPLIGDAA